jgi:putative MATE family efflux protein
MTQGNIGKLLVRFAIPLLLGSFLQQLYNAFDAIVVGNYVSSEALGAVGSAGPLMNMIIAFFMGMSTGASVMISQAFGARDVKSLQDTVHTAMTLSAVLGVILSVIGIAVTPALLEVMNTPKEIIPGATEYLQIFFSGMSALTVYNMGAAILTAAGDSRRPLYFLMLSTAINIVGDLWFVLSFDMGIAGVALSTVLSQIICAALVVVVLCRSNTEYKLYLRKLRIKLPILKRITMIGLPGGIQQAIISVSNIFVQGYINGLGAVEVSGYSASTKLDAFIMLPVGTMAMAVTTFVGQNLGARQVARARRGVRYSLILGLVTSIALSAVVLVFGEPLLRIFSPDPAIIQNGYEFMKVFAPLYFILCFTQILPGALRGAGNVRFATLTCIFCYVVLRQIYLFIATQISYTIPVVSLSYPLTWAVAAVVLSIYYRRSNWEAFGEPAAEE